MLLLMRTEREVKTDILKIETNKKEDQRLGKMTLATIVARMDI